MAVFSITCTGCLGLLFETVMCKTFCVLKYIIVSEIQICSISRINLLQKSYL